MGGVVKLVASAWLALFAAAHAVTPRWLARQADVASSFLLSAARLFAGGSVTGPAPAPARAASSPSLVLYEYEACPFCRRVREALCALDLDHAVRPCPRVTLTSYGVVDGSRFRPAAIEAGGQAKFPLLVDRTAGRTLYESADIVEYLFATYGGAGARRPAGQRLLRGAAEFLPVALRCRARNGALRAPSRAPARPLRLAACESDARWRIVREALCCLELEYEYLVRASGTRKAGPSRGLWDPNTGRSFGPGQSRAAAQYLWDTYKAGDFPNETMLQSYTTRGAGPGYGTVPGASKRL